MSDESKDLVKRAHELLKQEQLDPKEALAHAKRLEKPREFTLARRLLSRVSPPEDEETRIRLAQKRALYTYKDSGLQRHVALDSAWDILVRGDDPDGTVDAGPGLQPRKETLGLAGAIWKRNFELRQDKAALERALHYYEKGHRSTHPEPDFGWTGINAAYVLDALANLEAANDPDGAEARRERARALRSEVLEVLVTDADRSINDDWDPKSIWWYPATAAEAHLGLHQFAEAKDAIEATCAISDTPGWEKESTARQLARLSWLHGEAEPAANRAALMQEFSTALLPLAQHLRPASVAARDTNRTERQNREIIASLQRGKLGLALSGGGFRASLFHIGVLARLAEHDVLRDIEALSCVSGGSILGAHYFLALREQLVSRSEAELEQDDYLNLVDKVGRNFLAGVQKNVRTRVGANFIENLKMLVGLRSRTERLASLYDDCLYNEFKPADGKHWTMPDLRFVPAGEAEGFDPIHENWRRLHKIPELILNATTLNTGHNFQFTPAWMGEPPEAVDALVDTNERLRRLDYAKGPSTEYQQFALSRAVAASSCVPGLFEPLSMRGLYAGGEGAKEQYSIELVDGGVHDNQGVAALLGRDCELVLISDASGQTGAQVAPSDAAPSVLFRTNDILMGRVRTSQAEDVEARQRSQQLRGAMFIHLRSDLNQPPVNWIGDDDPLGAADYPNAEALQESVTSYGILKTVQARLSSIRTDLDSFSDIEACALMLSGYEMTAEALQQGVGDLPLEPSKKFDWFFEDIKDAMTPGTSDDTQTRRLNDILAVAKERWFKIWHLEPKLKRTAVALGLVALLLLLLAALGPWSLSLVTTSGLAVTLLIVIAGLVGGPLVAKILNLKGSLWKVLVGLGVATVGYIGTRVHLKWFDPRYLAWGKLDELSGGSAKQDSANEATSPSQDEGTAS